MRFVLVLLMVAVLIGSRIEYGTHECMFDEHQRDVMRDANRVPFRILFLKLWSFLLLNVGFGLPITAHWPWGLPPIGVLGAIPRL